MRFRAEKAATRSIRCCITSFVRFLFLPARSISLSTQTTVPDKTRIILLSSFS
ncbi:hypothetical protein PR002_g8393 [Phytophthora rubi]|uniref:Uncharacterized protein n=1 Tax=Phytophthora rubi TaxID=129364 RepID=A0A6A3MXR8_9STRA|nr:hypothetical protein PR002_g8393 [Phytophthora rubi]